MQADGRLPAEQRRNYRHALDGFVRIARKDGAAALMNGWHVNICRAMAMTAGQLASYDFFKKHLLATPYFHNNVTTHFVSSFLSGFVATVICSPIDVTKTRVMNSEPGQYKGPIDCAVQIAKNEGPRGFYKGFMPSWIRLGPHTILTFLVMEQIKKLLD